MTLPIYPDRRLLPGLTYSSKWSPKFFNLPTATTAAGADIDLAVAATPLHDFELTYAFLRDGLGRADAVSWGASALSALEFRTLFGFHYMMGGAVGRFLYKNPDDRRVFQNKIGVGDGATTAFTLTRTFGANGYFGTEPVGQVDTAEAFNAYLNGSATPVDPSLYAVSTASPVANTITFGTAPPNGQAVTVDMSYFYYCKLADDANTFDKFMDRLWKIAKVTLHSCRAGA